MDLLRFKRLRALILAFATVLACGIAYFYWRTDSISDAIWFTITIISTLGMEDVGRFSVIDKIISSVLVISSVILFSFLIANISEMVLSGQLKEYFGKKKMKEKINELNQHYIVCGYGRIGKSICNGLLSEKLPHIIIENDKAAIKHLSEQSELVFIDGDANSDEVLKEAGISNAKGIFCALGEDASNLLTVLNARALNLDLRIVTRVSSPELEIRFIRAGADHCISPQSWGSHSMLLTMLNPNISQMLMQFMDKTIEEGTFYEITVPENSPVHDKTLGESGIRKASNVNVIGVRQKENNRIIVNPQANMVLKIGDTLICLGSREDFTRLRKHMGCK
ncbi:potassium channel protein [bacterium]|nr:potassium channel protein [bacterium]